MTMFNNKLVVAIKNNGKVLREQGDKVYLPFGSEYSILVKNLNSVRALVRIELDGVSVTDGEDLVVYGNSELDLERFMKKGNYEQGNRFKFIERTGKVEQHRGVGVEDGILRVEFQFEKVQPKPIVQDVIHRHYHDYGKRYFYRPYWYDTPYYGSGYLGSAGDSFTQDTLIGSAQANNVGAAGGSVNTVFVNNAFPMNSTGGGASGSLSSTPVSSEVYSSGDVLRSRKLTKSAVKSFAGESVQPQSVNDAGITVAGSVSDQKFQTAAWFEVDSEKFVICLKLLGETETGKTVEKPVLVRQKQTCATCGTRNRGQNKFCRDCGTALELVGESPKRRVAAKR